MRPRVHDHVFIIAIWRSVSDFSFISSVDRNLTLICSRVTVFLSLGLPSVTAKLSVFTIPHYSQPLPHYSRLWCGGRWGGVDITSCHTHQRLPSPPLYVAPPPVMEQRDMMGRLTVLCPGWWSGRRGRACVVVAVQVYHSLKNIKTRKVQRNTLNPKSMTPTQKFSLLGFT